MTRDLRRAAVGLHFKAPLASSATGKWPRRPSTLALAPPWAQAMTLPLLMLVWAVAAALAQ